MRRSGFTLVELSLVIVIVGLMAGLVLVGLDMIGGAVVRGQIGQIEKYNTSVHTFQAKYNCLPGDCANGTAFGFTPRGTGGGTGDGNGVIEGNDGAGGGGSGVLDDCGETSVFWRDLSEADLIDGSFYSASETARTPGGIAGTAIKSWLPTAKIGNNNFIYVWSQNRTNYFGLSTVTGISPGLYSKPALTPSQAYNLDRKIDDGYPQSGTVTAEYVNCAVGASCYAWATGNSAISGPSDSSATDGSGGTTCYDNDNMPGTQQHYSTEINNGNNPNCAVSFRFQ